MKELKRSKQRSLKLERFLAKKSVIIILLLLQDVAIYLLGSYLLNVILHLGDILKNPQNPKNYLELQNFIPDFQKNREITLKFNIICLFIFLVLNLYQAYKFRVAFSEEGFNLKQKGRSRWTTKKEIQKQYTKIPDRDKPFPGYGGTIISRMGNDLYIDQSLTNNLIIGITRSGKGEMFVLPTIDVYSRAEKKASMIVFDPKTELYKSSKQTLLERGYEVRQLSLVDPVHSMGFNPLSQIVELYKKGIYDDAELLIQSFCYSIFNPDKPTGGDTFWQDSPTSLLAALILAVVEDCVKQNQIDNEYRKKIFDKKCIVYEKMDQQQKEEAEHKWKLFHRLHPTDDYVMEQEIYALPSEAKFEERDIHLKKINMYSIINMFGELASQTDPEDPYVTGLDLFFKSRPALDRAKLKYYGIEVAGARTKSSIYSSMLIKLTIFTYEGFAKMTAESSINLEDIGFGDKPMAIFVEMPDYDKSAYFLGTVFIRQLYFVLARRATREKSGKCKNVVKIVADEFGNMPAIESMDTIMTVCLGRNISFDLYIQAYSQMTKLYGENAKTIAGNCGNTIYILSDDDETTTKISKNLGTETIVDVQRSGKRLSLEKNITESNADKPLLDMNEIEELKPGECVIKRTMKRTDNHGKSVVPHPIFNCEETGTRLLFRYEYLTDTFPNPDEISMEMVNEEDRSYINLAERVWDYRLSFAMNHFKNEDETEADCIGDLENYETLKVVFDNLGVKLPKKLRVDVVLEQIDMLKSDGEIDEKTYNKLISLIQMGAET